MTEEITLAELCKYWNPKNNMPADTTRFGPMMTTAFYQQQTRDQRRQAEEAAAADLLRQEAPPEPVALATPAPPVRRPAKRAKVPPTELEA